jgi:hypothetical protein
MSTMTLISRQHLLLANAEVGTTALLAIMDLLLPASTTEQIYGSSRLMYPAVPEKTIAL